MLSVIKNGTSNWHMFSYKQKRQKVRKNRVFIGVFMYNFNKNFYMDAVFYK